MERIVDFEKFEISEYLLLGSKLADFVFSKHTTAVSELQNRFLALSGSKKTG